MQQLSETTGEEEKVMPASTQQNLLHAGFWSVSLEKDVCSLQDD